MTFPLVIDVSHWNGPADWNQVKAKGVSAAIIRAGSIDDATGICYKDWEIERHLAGARSVKMPYAFYWYFRPKYSGVLQAEYFSYLMNDLNIPVCTAVTADVEVSGVNPEQTAGTILDFMTVLPSPIIYTRQSFWDSNVAPYPNWNMCNLWAARYNTALTGPWSDGHFVFRDWDTWKFWQFSSTGLAVDYGFDPNAYNPHNLDANGVSRGYSKALDLSYFNGTEAELLAYFGDQYPQAEPPPAPVDPLEDVKLRLVALEETVMQSRESIALHSKEIEDLITALKDNLPKNTWPQGGAG